MAAQQGRFIGGKEEGLKGDDVLWVDPEGKSLLLAFQQTIYDYPSVYSIDISTNKSTQVVKQRDEIWDWYADDQGVVRTGIGFNSTGWSMIYRKSAEDKFQKVLKAKFDDDDAGFDGFRITQGSDEGYRIMNNEASGKFALYKFNFATRKRGDLVLEHAGNDIDDFDTTLDNKGLYSASFTDDRWRIYWFDPAMKALQESLDKAVGAKQAYVVSRSRDDKMMMVRVGSASDPGSYYAMAQAEGTMKRVAKVNDKLAPADLAPSHYLQYKARDGLDISAYLTLPKGRAAKNLPLIILPHGGPYDVRDEGEYDSDVQFLANRGYAVLQPNFRGSGGYGKGFYEKGEGQWGRAMQDDLDDGMDWLVKAGVADAKRVCLIGGSYGGYAALWGAVRNPERYRCAASFAGISDLARQLKYQITFKISKRYRKDWRKTVQGAEGFDLKTVSPLYNIAALKVPVLLMHGDKDQRVPFKQSQSYADALQAAGKNFEFYPLAGEGHGFSTSANNKQWLDRLEVFLAKYNPVN
jgi:dipeptidyl aminopeptidase/acylaminoacyl peptidase